MSRDWESHLERWSSAGLIDTGMVERIRAWESEQAHSQGLRWPVLLALAFGVVLLGAGVLLFVSAHWDGLSPEQRMGLVLMMVAVFHAAAAAVASRFENAAIALHTVGTVTLGAGIALAGQIFNLAEHWPSAIMLWAIGAALAWALLKHWTQPALTAILVPCWLSAEWLERVARTRSDYTLPVLAGLCALSFSYLTARRSAADSPLRKALGWIGGVALLPCALLLAIPRNLRWQELDWLAWTIVILGPLAVALLLRGRAAWENAVAVAWTLLLAWSAGAHQSIPVYICCAIGAVGLSAWGIRDARAERINLGMAGFAMTVLVFYFDNVMDKLDRSASLILIGLLFLGGGWLLERTRRRLLSHIRQEAI